MEKFLKALKDAERVLQEAWDFLLKNRTKTAGTAEREWAQHLVSVIKSVLILLDKYGTPEVPGYNPHDFSSLKVSLKKLQEKLEAI